MSNNKNGVSTNYKVKVFNVLKDLGVSPSLVGYDYISSIIEGYLTDKFKVTDKVMYVYTKTAEMFNTTCSRVERYQTRCGEVLLEYK